MNHYAIISLPDGLDDLDTLRQEWNADPELAINGKAIVPGTGQSFPLDPATLSGVFVIALAATAGVEAIKSAITSLMRRRSAGVEFKIRVDPLEDGVVEISIEKTR